MGYIGVISHFLTIPFCSKYHVRRCLGTQKPLQNHWDWSTRDSWLDKKPWLKMYFLLNMERFHWCVSLSKCIRMDFSMESSYTLSLGCKLSFTVAVITRISTLYIFRLGGYLYVYRKNIYLYILTLICIFECFEQFMIRIPISHDRELVATKSSPASNNSNSNSNSNNNTTTQQQQQQQNQQQQQQQQNQQQQQQQQKHNKHNKQTKQQPNEQRNSPQIHTSATPRVYKKGFSKSSFHPNHSANGQSLVWGLVVWIPRIPLWKGLLLGCTPRIRSHQPKPTTNH